MLVWITGNPGVGKSTVCERMRASGLRAVDADWDGYNHWVHRATGTVIDDPPYPILPGWTVEHAWEIDIHKVSSVAETCRDETVFIVGSVENEVKVWEYFDVVICLVADDETLRSRLGSRTTNAYGKNPEELAIALERNQELEEIYRGFGAHIIDGTLPIDTVVERILAVAGSAI